MAPDTGDMTKSEQNILRDTKVLPVEQGYGGEEKGTGVTRNMPPKAAVNARQGVISGRVITVLVVSLTLAIVAMILAYVFYR